ncbi:MAG: hypothetical protein AAFR61_31645 [Bacteroidota bacterium]
MKSARQTNPRFSVASKEHIRVGWRIAGLGGLFICALCYFGCGSEENQTVSAQLPPPAYDIEVDFFEETGEIKIWVESHHEQDRLLRVFNQKGKEYFRRKIHINSHDTPLCLSASGWDAGPTYVSLGGGNSRKLRRLVLP